MGLFFGTPKTSPARSGKFLMLTMALLVGLVIPAPANAIGIIPRDIGFKSTPTISGVFNAALVRPNEWVELEGLGFAAVTQVFVDGKNTSFVIQDDTLLAVLIPSEVNPGDVVIKLSGAFGSVTKQNLFEVAAADQEQVSKVTIGTFQGYAAVYTKKFRGLSLTISVAGKERKIQQLASDFTQNLTFIGAGKTVTVMVYLDRKLVRVQQLQVR